MDYYNEIYNYANTIQTVDCHSHFGSPEVPKHYGISDLIRESYVCWSGEQFDENNLESIQQFIHRVKYTNSFLNLQDAVNELYGISRIDIHTWNEIDEAIKAHNRNEDYRKRLKRQCGLMKVILDAYWKPGYNHDMEDIFSSAFRIDPLLFGYDYTKRDHDNNSAGDLLHGKFTDIDSYCAATKALIAEKVSKGSVVVKCASAYDRGLDFKRHTREAANAVFEKQTYDSNDIKAFQDYLMYEICGFLAEIDIPIQIHTGLGCMHRTNAMWLRDLICENNNTKFILLHGSIPWNEDVLALAFSYWNVYTDVTWLPVLSPAILENYLTRLIEMGMAERIIWGSDAWTVEETYGALKIMKETLAKVLEKYLKCNQIDMEDAKELVRKVLYKNAQRIFFDKDRSMELSDI